MSNHPVSAIDCQGDRTSRNSVSWYIKQIKSEIVIKHFNNTFWSLCNISSHVIYLVSHAKYIWFLCRYSSYFECFMQLFLLYMFCIIDKRWILILYLFTMITRIIVKRISWNWSSTEIGDYFGLVVEKIMIFCILFYVTSLVRGLLYTD